jgi:hypothetical protein
VRGGLTAARFLSIPRALRFSRGEGGLSRASIRAKVRAAQYSLAAIQRPSLGHGGLRPGSRSLGVPGARRALTAKNTDAARGDVSARVACASDVGRRRLIAGDLDLWPLRFPSDWLGLNPTRARQAGVFGPGRKDCEPGS